MCDWIQKYSMINYVLSNDEGSYWEYDLKYDNNIEYLNYLYIHSSCYAYICIILIVIITNRLFVLVLLVVITCVI